MFFEIAQFVKILQVIIFFKIISVAMIVQICRQPNDTMLRETGPAN
jgi:hypothetical protein